MAADFNISHKDGYLVTVYHIYGRYTTVQNDKRLTIAAKMCSLNRSTIIIIVLGLRLYPGFLYGTLLNLMHLAVRDKIRLYFVVSAKHRCINTHACHR